MPIPATRRRGAVPYVEVPASMGRTLRPLQLAGPGTESSRASGDAVSAEVLCQRTLSEHAQERAELVRARIDAELRTQYSERGVQIWWRTRRGRLGMLTAAELFDLGCFETLLLECSRTTPYVSDVALSDRDHAGMLDTLRAMLRLVTEQDPQVSER